MCIKKLIYLALFSLILSCDYVRKQEVPEGIDIVSEELVGTKNIYNIFRYQLSGLTSFNFNSWNRNLICEGYSDRSMKIDWHMFNPAEIERDLSYFYNALLEFGENIISFNNDLVVGGCKTEWITESNSKLNTINHVVYFLDIKKQLLIEVRSVD